MIRGGPTICFRISGALAILVLSAAQADLTVPSTAPSYTAAGIVHSATQTSGYLAPNTIATLYGSNLSFTTQALAASDLDSGTLPTGLGGTKVIVYGLTCSLFYVSPTQINFIIPYEPTGSQVPVTVLRQGVAGPSVTIPLSPFAPAFFEWNGNLAVAQHSDARATLISPDAPARPGEIVVLYATGLGRTTPAIISGEIVSRATPILYLSQLQITLAGNPVPQGSILYAGLTPGMSGLYQINLRLPATLPPNPEIRMTMGSQTSPASVYLPVQ